MPLNLPEPIAAYFRADRENSTTIAQCFTEDAVVVDENRTYTGRDAIARWKAGASSQYEYTSEPFAIAHEDKNIVVTSRVTGNFPGSPVNLRYAFVLEGDAIARLEITL